MEARFLLATASLAVAASLGASYRSANFIVEAPSPALAEEIGKAAEQYRHDLAIEWLGSAMPNWSRPCPIRADVAPNLGAGGATSFVFDKGEVFGWDMKIQGSEERVLDSVLPHEVTHTIFASYFRKPLPRWADEGACTTVEHVSEKSKQQVMLVNFLKSGRGIAFDDMFAMKEYPADVLPLYSQGYSLARFLIEQKGRREFLDFVGEGMKTENWPSDLKKHYGYTDLKVLQGEWLEWVKKGSPVLKPAVQLALATRPAAADKAPLYRAQSGDHDASDAPLASTTPLARHHESLADAGAAKNDTGWSSAETPKTPADRGSVIPANSGWYASQSGAAAVASQPAGSEIDAKDNLSPERRRPSVYDRRAAAVTQPPLESGARNDSPAGDGKKLAQIDSPAAAAAQHRVLLYWSAPQEAPATNLVSSRDTLEPVRRY
jgi:hypothetical protein